MSLYSALFGKGDPVDASVSDFAEHGRVGGISTGQSYKHVVSIDPDTGNPIKGLPTAGNNPSLVLEYTGDNLTKLIKTINGTSYEKTLSYTDSDLTGVSAWTEV